MLFIGKLQKKGADPSVRTSKRGTETDISIPPEIKMRELGKYSSVPGPSCFWVLTQCRISDKRDGGVPGSVSKRLQLQTFKIHARQAVLLTSSSRSSSLPTLSSLE